MNRKNKQTELYSAPAIKVVALEARRVIMVSPSGEHPGGTGHDFGDPIEE